MERAETSSGKRHKVLDDEQNVDRLSALPDGVICHHILSLLPTKLSVSTSILAKRWRFLWAHVPVLDFNSWYYVSEQATSLIFPGIICAVMLRHKVQSLNTFCLKYLKLDDSNYNDDGYDDDNSPKGCYLLDTCIATAIERNVQNLYLHLEVELPPCCLTCKTLVDLRLCDGVSIPPSSGPTSLPSLKKLYFDSIDDDVHLPRLLSGCPVLEELIICRVPCFDSGGCTISSPTLKSLTLERTTSFSAYDIPDYRLKINAPALRYFKIHDYLYQQISVSLMNSLVEADICMDNFGQSDESNPCCVLEFLESLSNVNCLKLSADVGEWHNFPLPGSIVKFGNLTKLELTQNWLFLSKLLESADHLQVLIIHEWDCHSEHWMEPEEERCACLLYSLRIVRINGFKRKEQSFNMVRYILRNALVLERMDIGLKENFDAIQRISLFRRGSVECELAFS